MSEIVLDELYPLQAELDRNIQLEHHETYESTSKKRVLALLVELGEFANETRCFKFWSLKGPSPKEVILDEYADGMHFFLSLGIPLGISNFTHAFAAPKTSLTEKILEVYQKVASFSETSDSEHYKVALDAFLDILPFLNYSGADAIEAYKKKLAINYKRQENHY